MLLGLVSVAVLGLLYFNVSTLAENSSRKGEIEKLQLEIEDANAKLEDIAPLNHLASLYQHIWIK